MILTKADVSAYFHLHFSCRALRYVYFVILASFARGPLAAHQKNCRASDDRMSIYADGTMSIESSNSRDAGLSLRAYFADTEASSAFSPCRSTQAAAA